jgi:hypothetical protein
MSTPFSNPITAGGILVQPDVQSPNFSIAGQTGWAILQNGLAYFYDIILSGGTITGPDYIINTSGIFMYSGTPANGNLIVSIAPAAGTDAFGNVYVKGFEVSAGAIPGTLLNTSSVPASAVNFVARSIGGITTTTAATAPSGALAGDLWIDTASGNAIYQYSGSAWNLYQFGAAAVSFTATSIGGITTYVQSTAPSGANAGSLWIDTAAGNALYQYSGSAWTLYQFGSGSIAANSISAGQMVANTITASQIAAGTITTSQIAAGTITGSNIAAATIAASNIIANTITASQIAAGTITSTQIAAGTITAADLISGIVVAGIVNATTITGATIIADGSSGEFLIYSGTPANGNLIASLSANAGTDGYSNTYLAGLTVGNYPASGTYTNISATGGITTSGNLAINSSVVTFANDVTISGNEYLAKTLTFTNGGASVGLLPDANGYLRVVNEPDGNNFYLGSTTVYTTNTQTYSSTTAVAVTGLSLHMGIGSYHFKLVIMATTGASAGEAIVNFGGSTVTTTFASVLGFWGDGANFAARQTTTLGANIESGLLQGAGSFGLWCEGIVVTSAAGAFAVNASCSVAADTWGSLAGSFLTIDPIS